MNLSSGDLLNISNEIKVAVDDISDDLDYIIMLLNKLDNSSYWNSKAFNFYKSRLLKKSDTDNMVLVKDTMKQFYEFLESIVNNMDLAELQIKNGISINLNS